jgi:subtilase family serine protease/prenyltransferase beta subunit
MLIKILFRESMRTKRVRRKAQLAFICIAFLVSLTISAVSFGQDFTAKTIGDYGNVAVMEVTGNYDAKNPDGSINHVPRQAIAKEFFRTHKDEYDFLVIFSNFPFQMPDAEAKAFYFGVRNDAQGIGQQVFDNSGFFGSNGRLQGLIDMGDVSGLVTDPLDPKFEETLYILSHELMHRWGAYVKFKNSDGSISTALLGKDKSHWSFLLDSKASVLYGNQWQDNGDGTFTSIGAGKYYSPLDLYLMGFYDKSQVPPMLLIENPNIDPARIPEIGATISGTARYVTIDDIITAEGGRIPGPSDSQKIFKTAYILITTPTTFRGDEIYGIENIRNGWVTRFSVLTDGYGIVDVDVIPTEDIPTNPGLPEPPYTPRSIPPNIEDGVKWLMSHQGSDGSWMDLPQTTERDTAETALVLKNFDMAKSSYESGIQWLNTVPAGNMDYLSRKIEVLVQAGQDVKTLLDELVLRQNPDGGWGSNANYMSNPADTSFALKAMAVAGYSDVNIISRAIEYLKSKQNADGGWGNEDEASSIQSTANILLSFNKYRDYPLDSQVARGRAWLMQRQNPDGGFGNSPSTIYDTAIAVLTLREFGVSTDTINSGLNYILNLQSGDGSWYGSPYQTAVAVNAVWRATVDPDLSIKSDDITFTPPSVKSLPSNILMEAKIWNFGRTDVPQAKVVVYDGMVSEANKVSEQVVGFPGQSSVTVSFSVIIGDGNEHRFYISVDPENLVKESNETNNIASKILYPEPTFDLEILPSDISVSPNPVDVFSDVKIASKITNKGTINAYDVQVKYYIDEVGGPIDIATVTVDIPANSAVTKVITWRANKAGENLPITVYADPFNLFEELSKTNNKAFTYLTVKGSAEANLTVSYKDIIITPTPAQERGNVNLSALVKNEGFSTVSNINVSFYKGVPGKDGVLLGSQIIPSLNTGESKRVSIDWTNITDSGERIIYIQVDPGNQIEEIRKDDNDAFTTLKILSLPDLIISTNSIAFNPAAPKDGDMVAITVTVQNKGEQDASNVPVRAFEGDTVIGTQVIPSISGNSQSVASFTYDTAGKNGPHKITIKVDPDDTIAEQSKDNNQASRTFGVQKADLWLTEPYISPNGDGVKDSTQFFFRLNSAETVKISVVDKNAKAVRTFSGDEFKNTTGGNITWDGLDDFGRVVRDGQYQIEIQNEHGISIGSLLAVVDNNRSPLTEAFGTKFLLNSNLTCMVPSQALVGEDGWYRNPYHWGQWFPDDSGIALNIGFDGSKADKLDPAFPPGYYFVTNDGKEINRMVPWEWTRIIDPVFDYYNDMAMSPDGEMVAYTVHKWNKGGKRSVFYQLWVGDKDGRNLTLLDSYESAQDGSRDYYVHGSSWSPDGQYIAYSVVNGHLEYDPWWREYYRVDDYEEFWIIKVDGTGKTKIATFARSGNEYLYDFSWSWDSRSIAYVLSVYSDQSQTREYKLIVSDISANKREILTSEDYVWIFGAFNNQKIIVVEGGRIWLIDPSDPGSRIKLSDKLDYGLTFSSDHQKIYFTESVSGKTFVKGFDEDGSLLFLYENPISLHVSSFVWSPDSTKIAYVDYAYQKVSDCDSIGYIIVQDLKSGEKKAFEGLPVDLCYVPPPDSYYYLFPDVLLWLPDNYSILVKNSLNDIYVLDSETGERTELPIYSYQFAGLSALGRFITYYQGSDPSSTCYQRESNDIWVMSSLLNLTADLRVTKGRSEIILKGTAADLNFEGYRLEYADIKDPKVWYPIAPASDVPVMDDRFGTWVPPYEGIFYVRLTV